MNSVDEQQILKTRLAFCGYCNGSGSILVNFPIYKNETSPQYITCWQCKGTGMCDDWHRSGRYKPKQNRKCGLTAEQIRGLSEKNLRYLYIEEGLLVPQIAKRLNLSMEFTRDRLHLYKIRLRLTNRIKNSKDLINDLRAFVRQYNELPFGNTEHRRIKTFPHSMKAYATHFGSRPDAWIKCGIEKIHIEHGRYKWGIKGE